MSNLKDRRLRLPISGFLVALSLLMVAPVAHAQTVIATLPVGTNPIGVDVNVITYEVYVANQRGDSVTVIDAKTNTIIATVLLPAGSGPLAVAVNSHTNQVFVTDSFADSVTMINYRDHKVGATIPVPADPYGIGVNSDTNMVYVASPLSQVITVIDGQTDMVVKTIPDPAGQSTSPTAVAVNPQTNTIYVATNPCFFGLTICPVGNILVIDGSTNTITTTIPTNTGPICATAFGVNTKTNTIYESDGGSNSRVDVINGATNTVVGTVSIPGTPNPLVPSPCQPGVNQVTNRIYVAGTNTNSVYVIDGSTNTIVGGPVPVGNTPTGVAADPRTDTTYVANFYSNTVSVIAG